MTNEFHDSSKNSMQNTLTHEAKKTRKSEDTKINFQTLFRPKKLFILEENKYFSKI